LKKTNNLLFVSKSFEPWFNLAVEEYLTATIKSNQVILYLWQNNNTVVIGSNQNPWKECDVSRIRNTGIKLARRQSGGGAVFHDKGNLNYTFIAQNNIFDIEKQFTVIINAVKSFGFNAIFSGRNDILINNSKFSGNAFFIDDKASYHHGTLLIDSNLSTLSGILTPSKQKIESKGIDSVRARVMNLKELSNEISIDSMKERIINSFKEQYGEIDSETELTENSYDSEAFKKIYKTQSSWDWIYGDSPSFEAVHSKKFKWGEVEIGFNLIDGKVIDTKIYSDSLITSFGKKLSKALNGVKYDSDNIKKAIDSIDSLENEKEIFSDVKELFEYQCV
jgi:lipoate-protein ligase A